jgi:hypothetical protein
VELRENLNTVRIERLRNREIEIHYEIEIPNLDKWDLQAIIANTSLNPVKTEIDENNLNII